MSFQWLCVRVKLADSSFLCVWGEGGQEVEVTGNSLSELDEVLSDSRRIV